MPTSRHLILACALALTGCQASPFGLAPHFGLMSDRAVAPAPVAAAAAIPAGKGAVTVSFQQLLPKQRRLMSTLADVAYVTVNVLPAVGDPQSKTVTKAQIVAGQVSATFDGVPTGTSTFVVNVMDANDKLIGRASGIINVLAGQTTTVNAALPLGPTLAPTPTPSAGSGGGGDVPATGAVQANLGLQDGLTAQPLSLGARVNVGGLSMKRIFPDGQGHYWGLTSDTPGQLVKFDRTGSVLVHAGTPSDVYWQDMALLGSGAPVTLDYRSTAPYDVAVERHNPDGTRNEALTFVTSGALEIQNVIAVASDGAIWTDGGAAGTVEDEGLNRTTADGQTVHFATQSTVEEIKPAAGGAVYVRESRLVAGEDSHWLCKRSPGGALVWQVQVGSRSGAIAVAANDHLWAVVGSSTVGVDYTLQEFTPDGQLAGSHPLPPDLGDLGMPSALGGSTPTFLVAPTGTMWVAFQGVAPDLYTARPLLLRIAADGTPGGVYYLPEAQVMPAGCGTIFLGLDGNDLVAGLTGNPYGVDPDHTAVDFYHLP